MSFAKPKDKLDGQRIGVTKTNDHNVILYNRISDGGWRGTWLHETEALALYAWLDDVYGDTLDAMDIQQEEEHA